MKKVITVFKHIYHHLQVEKGITREVMSDDAPYYYCWAKYKKEYIFTGYFTTKQACKYALKRFTTTFIKEKI